MLDTDALITGISEEILKEVAKKSLVILKEETPVDKGNLRSSERLDIISQTEIDLVIGEQEQGGIFVDYQAGVSVKGTGGKIPNLYWIKAQQRIETEIL